MTRGKEGAEKEGAEEVEEKLEEVGAETGLIFNVGESEVIQALDLVIPLMEAGVNILQTCQLKIAEKINSLRFLALKGAFKRVLKSLCEHLSIKMSLRQGEMHQWTRKLLSQPRYS